MPTSITDLHIQLALYTAVIPALVAGVLVVMEMLLLRRHVPAAPSGHWALPLEIRALWASLRGKPEALAPYPRASLAAPVAIGGAIFAALVGLDGWPQLSPMRSTPAVALVALLLGFLGIGVASRPGFTHALAGDGAVTGGSGGVPFGALLSRVASTGFVALAVMTALAMRTLPQTWGAMEYTLLAVVLLGVAAVAALLDFATSTPVTMGWWVPLTFAISYGMASVILGAVAHSAIYAQLATAGAIGCGMAMLAGVWHTWRGGAYLFGPGAAFTAFVALAALMYSGQYFTYGLPVYMALLAAAAPAGIALVLVPGLGGWARWIAPAMALLIPGIPLALFLLTQSPENALGY
ncbi:hypothetical protein DB346_19380 [Verrucomicrobia bacterium LW23]|nr:hypothetical protein DB346_19380 [Verrucomicrobia bacterium LW23]